MTPRVPKTNGVQKESDAKTTSTGDDGGGRMKAVARSGVVEDMLLALSIYFPYALSSAISRIMSVPRKDPRLSCEKVDSVRRTWRAKEGGLMEA